MVFRNLVLMMIFLCSYSYNLAQQSGRYKTKNVIVIVIDGPRYSETWGDTSHRYIPHFANDLAPNGIVFTNFHNNGYTYTTSGHTAICTGKKERLDNRTGKELPTYPSFMQHYLRKTGSPSSKAWVITSKDKLAILADCKQREWRQRYNPTTNCGNNGLGSGYREDSITFKRVIQTLTRDKPSIMLVNFKEPDHSAHAGDWQKYIKGIKTSDSLVWEVWKFLQADPFYKNSTTLFVTNDHGRHLDKVKSGFVSHGDGCKGCRHINLFAAGPDFKKGIVEDKYYDQTSITATISMLLDLNMARIKGKPLMSILK